MPCYPIANDPIKQEAMDAAYEELEAEISSGRRAIVRNRDGTISIKGWAETAAARAGWCEGCIIAKAGMSSSWVVKSKLAAVGLTRGKQFVANTHRGHPHTVGRGHGRK